MGISGISPWSLLLILAIVIVLFGPKRLSNLGRELGAGLRQFRKGLGEEQKKDEKEDKSS